MCSLEAFLSATRDPTAVLSPGGAFVRTSAALAHWFGYEPSELDGAPLTALFPDGVGDALTSAKATRLTGRRKDGQVLPVDLWVSPLPQAEPPSLVASFREPLPPAEPEAHFHALLESAPDGIVVVDARGAIRIVNQKVERMFGYSRGELVGQPVERLVPERLRELHQRHREGFVRTPKQRPMGAGLTLTARRRDGSELPVEISLSPLFTPQGLLVTAIIRDVTDRALADERLRASLREKEVLLKEIHHRVKNNLQVTSSLLRLQSAALTDRRAKELFAESQLRIHSMALVHEKLYQSKELSQVDFGEYARSLGELLLKSYGAQGRVALSVRAEPVRVGIDTAVPCGLLLNELLSNCLKHAFPQERLGRVEVTVGPSPTGDGRMRLSVKDDGVGLPDGLRLESAQTLGLQLVMMMVKQLRGELEVVRTGGTELRVVVPRGAP